MSLTRCFDIHLLPLNIRERRLGGGGGLTREGEYYEEGVCVG